MNNVKKLIKEILFLEDLLFHKDKNQKCCVKEKLMFIEKLVEVIIESDIKEFKCYPLVFPIAEIIRDIQKRYPKVNNKDFQKLRKARKELMNNSFKYYKDLEYEQLEKKVNHKCRNKLMPILKPEFNIREVVKNMLLIEDHLLDKRRRCNSFF